METFEIKKGTCIETLDNTLLVVRQVGKNIVVFCEFDYNRFTCEYDILINENRIMTAEEIKVELYRSFGKNYKVKLIK